MTYLDDDKSIQDSRPRDLFQITMPDGDHYLTSSVKDEIWQGITWKSGTITRGNLEVSVITGRKELTVSMDISHAIPQRWMVAGGPPKIAKITLVRLQTNGDYRREWSGNIMSMAIAGRIATFVVPAASNVHLSRKLPTLLVGKLCPHFLYDAACRVNQTSFTVTRTASIVAGTRILLNSAPNVSNTWAKFGIFNHISTNQSMTITNANGAEIEIEAPIYELKSGDTVLISAGCDHTIVDCDGKFVNMVNYGGFPHLPTKNPFIRDGFGVVEQA